MKPSCMGCVLLYLEVLAENRGAPQCAAARQEVAMPLRQQEASGFSNLAQLALQDLTGHLTVSER